MNHHYIPSVAAVIALLLALIVVPSTAYLPSGSPLKTQVTSAQTVDLNQEIDFQIEFRELNVKTEVIPGGTEYEFDHPIDLLSVHTTYCCFSGSIQVFLNDVIVNEQQKALHTCKRCSNDFEDVIWQMPPGTKADKIRTPEARFLQSAQIIDIVGSTVNSVTGNEAAKELGRLPDFFNTAGSQRIGLTSNNPEVKVWVGKEDDFNRVETGTFTDRVYACADSDENGQCDFLTIACNDGIDNDGDGRTDFPSDPGCEAELDPDETDTPLCRDGIDNDNDNLIDFPSDPGCSSPDDGDETDPPPPPIPVTVSFEGGSTTPPQVRILPPFQDRNTLEITPHCGSCVVTSVPDHTQFVGGSDATNEGFAVIATSTNPSTGELRHLIIAVEPQGQQGQAYEEHSRLFTESGLEYSNLDF